MISLCLRLKRHFIITNVQEWALNTISIENKNGDEYKWKYMLHKLNSKTDKYDAYKPSHTTSLNFYKKIPI